MITRDGERNKSRKHIHPLLPCKGAVWSKREKSLTKEEGYRSRKHASFVFPAREQGEKSYDIRKGNRSRKHGSFFFHARE